MLTFRYASIVLAGALVVIALLYSFWIPATKLGWLTGWPDDALGTVSDAFSSDDLKCSSESDTNKSIGSEPLAKITFAGRNSMTRLLVSGGEVTPRSSARNSARSSGLGVFTRSLLAAESDTESQAAGLDEGSKSGRSKAVIEDHLFGQTTRAAK